MRGITLQRLQVFCAVYERSSISAAARMLGLSQPTVSRHLRDFEAAANLTLFLLEKGRVWPTAEADALYSESRFLQDGIGRMESRVESLRQGTGSKLAVMTVGMLMPQILPPAISDLVGQMPGLRLSVDVATASRQLEALRSGLIDIGIMAGHVATDAETIVPLGSGRLVALMPRSQAPADGCVALEDVARMQTVDSTARGPIGRILDAAVRERGIAFEGAIMCNSLIAVPPLAQALQRAAVLDEFTAQANPLPGMATCRLEPKIEFPILAASLSPSGSRLALDNLVDLMRLALSIRATD